MSNELKEFLREKQSKASPAGTDWAAKRDAWIAAVGRLYDTIENDFLGAASDTVKIDRTGTRAVQEPYIGAYDIAVMTLAVGNELVTFTPKGVQVAGAAGRVDVRGDRGEAALVRGTDETWQLLLSRTPSLVLIPLTDATFLEMLRRVMR